MPNNSQVPAPSDFGCRACAGDIALDFDFTMAFQPIFDVRNKSVFAQEALCRGLNGEPAHEVIAQVNDTNRYRFDQMCRVKAVRLAAKLKINSYLSINFLPNAVYRPENCIRTTIRAASEYNFPLDKIIFEITEVEKVSDNSHLKNIVTEYQRQGFKTAIDDFGAGYSGLNLLAVFQPDFLKLDMELIRDINLSRIKQAIVKGILYVANDLGIEVIAEGIENENEFEMLQSYGINLMQGYYFAKPSLESLAELAPNVLSTVEENFAVEMQELCTA